MIENQGQPQVLFGEGRVLANEHRVDVGQVDVFRFGERDGVGRVEAHGRVLDPPDDAAAAKANVTRQAMVDTVTSGLCLEHEGETGVLVDDDGRHGIHDEDETHDDLR